MSLVDLESPSTVIDGLTPQGPDEWAKLNTLDEPIMTTVSIHRYIWNIRVYLNRVICVFEFVSGDLLISLIIGHAGRSEYYEQIYQCLYTKKTETTPTGLGSLGSADDLRRPCGDTAGACVPPCIEILSR